ncbi:cytochrome P450 [Marinimicrobium sp. C6131]|uniref:cytochrome P450 n=1 Tax=unclassified Marinimicrobium TaxID=2632100 RepID=UPI00223CAA5E|nr:cytochrome P450 [Marinimicrobium sp. C6131]UZJ45436.1 cytochrome P450 [Marinimicrobium sp. C6131]
MPQIPIDRSRDSTLALLRDPYDFIAKRCQRYQSDVFQTRLLLRPTICMSGPEAAQLFYDTSRFVRSGAAPGRIQKTLFGRGGVQGLDDDAHRHRKKMFLSLMTPERLRLLAEMASAEWDNHVQKWSSLDKVVLYDESQVLLTRAVCAWAGIPLEELKVGRRTRELAVLFDAAGSVGPRHWWSRLARQRAERWAAGMIEQVRNGKRHAPEQSALQVVALHRELNGERLSPRIAAVELLNVLRPTVAVSVYVTFAAYALHQYPDCQRKLAADEDGYAELFIQEIRRFYPFFPAVMARVRHGFDWKGYNFPAGRRVMLDLHGTNHDARIWEAPEAFRPERFRQWDGSPFNFIPQGGGEHQINHRCPGEWITIDLIKIALDVMLKRMRYDVPAQDLEIDMSRLPALPRSRLVISNVQAG